MKDLRELLLQADPLRDEQEWPPEQKLRLHAIVEAASDAGTVFAPARARSPRVVLFTTAAMMIGASILGPRVWSIFVGDLQGAVRFEVKLAEDGPGPGLRQAKVSGSDRLVYLHPEAIVTNSDIARARAVPGPGQSEYYIGIGFNASGTEKMRTATANHLGRPLAILLNGQVVMAPVLRSPIAASARVTGNFTRAEAERIVHGIEIRE